MYGIQQEKKLLSKLFAMLLLKQADLIRTFFTTSLIQ